ncbi:MAG: LysO family transporter [Candidatus Caldatribacteriaceae bacterium]
MLLLFIALLLGFFVGTVKSIPQQVTALRHTLISGGILLLLFSMGVSIGTNPQITKNLKTIGLQAFLFSLFTTFGGAFCAFCAERILQKSIRRRNHQ